MRNAIIMLITVSIFLSFFTVILPVETCVASGNTIYVDNDYDGSTPGWQIDHFDKIKDGVNAANINDTVDTVYVYSGEYHEYNIVITSDLTLTGENKAATIIDGDKNGHVIAASGSAGNEITFSISGFTIKNAGGEGNDCIAMSYVNDGDVNDNIIINSDRGDGIQLDHCSGITISDNAITNNDVNGIHFILSTDNTVENNQIQNNQRGIRIYLSSNNNVIYDNTITANNQYGIRILQSQNNRIYLNDFTSNGQNAHDSSSNDWSYNSQGNYWDDYMGYDNNSDGIGDTPYDIPGDSNQDMYPLGYFAGENQKPVATIDPATPNSATQGQTVSFSGHGEDSDGYITGYNWRSSKDGQLNTQTSFSTSSLSVGTHTIYFKVKDDDNEWSDEVSTNLVINSQDNQKPTAIIVNPDSPTSTVTYGEPVDFHGYGLPSEGMIIEWSWRSSIDGILSSESTFTKSDLSNGTHIIYFKVKDSNGWSDEVSTSLVIELGSPPSNEPPVADAGGPYTGYVNVSVSFDASGSYDPDGDEIVSYVWDFGDGTNGTGMSIEHTYNSNGNYIVNLTIADSKGNSSTISTYANVSIQPTDQNSNGRENGDTPGFEIILVFIAVIMFLILKKH